MCTVDMHQRMVVMVEPLVNAVAVAALAAGRAVETRVDPVATRVAQTKAFEV